MRFRLEPCSAACVLLLLMAAPALVLSPAAFAQTKEEVAKKLEKSRQQLNERQRREQNLKSDVGDLKAERDRLSASLVETARLIQKSEGQLGSIESRLAELEAQEKLLQGSLAQRHT